MQDNVREQFQMIRTQSVTQDLLGLQDTLTSENVKPLPTDLLDLSSPVAVNQIQAPKMANPFADFSQ